MMFSLGKRGFVCGVEIEWRRAKSGGFYRRGREELKQSLMKGTVKEGFD